MAIIKKVIGAWNTMEITSPGFKIVRAARPYGNAGAKLVGIVLAEHAPEKNESSWYAGPTYDVLTIADQNVLRAVKLAVEASGSSDIVCQRLQVSDPAVASRVYGAVSGGSQMPKMSELTGARVLVEFLDANNSMDAGEPFIRSCFFFREMAASKIPNARTAAENSSDVSPDYLDDITKQVESDPALKDSLTGENQAGVLWKARNTYLGEDGSLIPPPPRTASTQEKRDLWESAFEVAWSAGFQNTYWDSGFDATSDGAIRTEFDNCWLAENADDEETSDIMRNGWLRGWKQGDIDAKKEAAINPPPTTDADNSGAVLADTDDAAEAADRDIEEWHQVAAKGNTAVWYIEKKGTRLAIGADGSFTIDARTSAKPIRIQGGDDGITLSANGAIITLGTDNDDLVEINSGNVMIGDSTTIVNAGVMWEPLKTILQTLANMITQHTHELVLSGAPETVITTAMADITIDDTPKSAAVKLI